MTHKGQTLNWLLFISAGLGVVLSYFPNIIGKPINTWLTELIITFSYFTIISNFFIVLMAASLLFTQKSNIGKFFNKVAIQTALAVYITITALVYHGLIAHTWQPQGIDIISDALLHKVTPALFLLFWFSSSIGKPMHFIHTLPMLLTPLIFLIYWLIRGPIIGSYPYFFIDVEKFGGLQVAINCLGLCIAFWFVAIVYWLINKLVIHRRGLFAQQKSL